MRRITAALAAGLIAVTGFAGTATPAKAQTLELVRISASTVGAVADRALECGIVKPDPVTPLDQLFAGSSQMSSKAGLPDIRTLIPALPAIR